MAVVAEAMGCHGAAGVGRSRREEMGAYEVPAEFLEPFIAGAVVLLEDCIRRFREKLQNEGERKHLIWMIGPEVTEKHRRAADVAGIEATEATEGLAEASALVVALQRLQGDDGETCEFVGAPEAVREAALEMAQAVLPNLLAQVQSYTPFSQSTVEGTAYVTRALSWAQAASMDRAGGGA